MRFVEKILSIKNEYTKSEKIKTLYVLGFKFPLNKKSTIDPRFYTSCDIGHDIKTLIDKKRIFFPHPVGIVISSKAKLGCDIKIWQNVTIGAKEYDNWQNQKYPVIEHDVIIYAGAKIIGDVKIGRGAIIGANAVVVSDVEPYSTYAGIPAKMIKRFNSNADALKNIWTSCEKKSYQDLKESHIIAELSKDSICIDCGANIGKVSEIFANTGAKVYAFEPNPLCHAEIEKICKENSNIELLKYGVTTKNIKCRMYHNDLIGYDSEFFSQSSSIYASKENVSVDNYCEIECIDLCEFIQNLNKTVDVLKMDIEGAEFDLLEKIIKTGLYKKIKYIIVETHENSIPEIRNKSKEVRNLIKELNINNIDLNWC